MKRRQIQQIQCCKVTEINLRKLHISKGETLSNCPISLTILAFMIGAEKINIKKEKKSNILKYP